MKLNYTVSVTDLAGVCDAGVATSIDVVPPSPPPPPPPPPPPGTHWAVVADLGPLIGDPAVAPIALGDFEGSGPNTTPFGSTKIRVVKDPTGLLGGNVAELDYDHSLGAGSGSADENTSFVNRKPLTVGFGEKLRVEMELLIPKPTDPARDRDQRKLLYFKAKGIPGGFSSFFVIKFEGNDLSTTLPNPGGNTKTKVFGFAGGKFAHGVPHNLTFELHMNSRPYDGTVGDGRFIAWVDGLQAIDLQNCVIMEGKLGPFPLTKFHFGDQWQSISADTTIKHSEKRYIKTVRMYKYVP